jgi:hypothetical protein
MQFKVPQFLEIEDKIFGPFTFRQFAYLAGGAGFCFVIYKILGLVLGAIPILIMAGFAVALTFYRPNDKPFINMIEAGFKYFTQNKLYIWKKEAVKENIKAKIEKGREEKIKSLGEMRLTGSKLRDLAWSLDVLDLSKENKN